MLSVLLIFVGIGLVAFMLRQLSYQKSFLFKSNQLLAKQRNAVMIGVIGFIIFIIALLRMR